MSDCCPECGGTGFRIVESGRLRRAVRCACHEIRRAERLLSAARIPARFRDADFTNFETDAAWPSLRRARDIAFHFVTEYPDVDSGILFLGPPGVGKTHLAVAILKTLIAEKGAQGTFTDFRDLLKTIQGSWEGGAADSEAAVLQPVLRAQILVLDDLGAGRATGWVQETLFHILSSRYNERRLTVLTSNLPDQPAGLLGRQETLEQAIGSPLRSRLEEMCRIISIDAEDYRRQTRKRGPAAF